MNALLTNVSRGDVLPGRAIGLGVTGALLGIAVFLPLTSIALALHGVSVARLLTLASSPRLFAALRLTFGAAMIAASVNLLLGGFFAWVLARQRFFGKRWLEASIDIPFALPTAVTGVTLATLYGPQGLIGHLLARWGINVAFTPLGICLALTFVGLPFVVRTLQPAIAELPREFDEASTLLGAGPFLRFARIGLPLLAPALLNGFALAFARGIGEYGSVIFIAGNMPGRTEVASLLILTKLEEYDQPAAALVALILLIVSFGVLLGINGVRNAIVKHRTAL